jgi:ABC-type uncharacterized transport system ATPase subunit
MVVEHDMGFIRQISDIVTVLCAMALCWPKAALSKFKPMNA